jgi:beta-alanine degradation protein BauB
MHGLASYSTAFAAGALVTAGLYILPSHKPAAPQATPAPQTGRVSLLQNDDVHVWRSLILPNAPLTMHRHEHPRIIIPLQSGTMNIVDSGGSKEVHVWEKGNAYWLPTNPPGTTHADVNAGDKPIEVVVVELEHTQ